MKRDPGATGNFEVTLVETNELIHSKQTGGYWFWQGKCGSDSERDVVLAKIKEFLSK